VDWDGDGMLDLIVGERYGFIHYYRRTSNDAITLEKQKDLVCNGTTIDVGYNSAPVVVDWNEDGNIDMLVGSQGNYSGGVGTVQLYLNTASSGEPVFTSYSYIENAGSDIDWYRNCPQVYDLNEDGKKDLLCGLNNYHVYYLENVGTNAAPVFNGYESLIYKYAGMRFWMCDFNGDALTDVLSSDYNGYVWVWIQMTTGVGGSGIEVAPRTLTSSSNPFMESVMIRGEGFTNATLSIFDISGHRVVSAPFDGDYTWSGDIATGAYFVQVEDGQGVETLRLIKL
jgi:hypothetical protein